MATDEGMGHQCLDVRLFKIRESGWMVVCHNDYMLKGDYYTYWSFARGNEYVKGEGHTDHEALEEVEGAIKKLTGQAQ